MARKPVLFSSLVKPIKAWWQRIFFSVGIVACTLFLLMDRGEVGYVREIRLSLTDALMPITQTIFHPIKFKLTKLVSQLSFRFDITKMLEIESLVSCFYFNCSSQVHLVFVILFHFNRVNRCENLNYRFDIVIIVKRNSVINYQII